jgi:hypothetical protein
MRSGFGDVKNVTAGFREVPFAVRCNHTFARNAAFETPAVVEEYRRAAVLLLRAGLTG